MTIVHRSRRFEGFTVEGERVVTWAHRILAEQREMRADIDRMKGVLTATARIGAIPTAVSAAPFLTHTYLEQNPASSCQILTLPSREISRMLTEFELDAGLTYLDDETPPGTRRIPLYRERYLLLGPDDHPQLAQPQVGWPTVAEFRLCALTSQMRNRRIIDARLAGHGVITRPIVEANIVDALWVHLRTGRLAAVVAHPWLHAFGVPEGMIARPIDDPVPGPAVGLIVLDHARSSVVTEAILEAARSTDVAQALEGNAEARRS